MAKCSNIKALGDEKRFLLGLKCWQRYCFEYFWHCVINSSNTFYLFAFVVHLN